MRRILAFCAYARSGKDTAAAVLVEQGWQRIAFADAVRDFALVINPWIGTKPIVNYKDDAFFTSIPVCRRLSELVEAYGWDEAKKNPEVRQLLIDIGMGGREKLYPSIFMDVVRRKIDSTELDASIVITDCRFANEAVMLREMGGKVVRVVRHDITPQGGPDLAVDEIEPDAVVLNDTTVEFMQKKVLGLVNYFWK